MRSQIRQRYATWMRRAQANRLNLAFIMASAAMLPKVLRQPWKEQLLVATIVIIITCIFLIDNYVVRRMDRKRITQHPEGDEVDIPDA